MIEQLEKLLDGPRDGPLLRFSLGNAYLKAGQAERAADFYRDALARDPDYSAAWQGLGKALAEAGQPAQAWDIYQQGIAVAQARGDIQAARMMGVFAKRLAAVLDNKGKTA
ncbi:tetratricopeptide repeat protein [Chitinimonas arctica]|uniref:Tetratricopeptide repeat protein n=1 Tax=Chitinimonas arctica TaxID=2594795 RepID=A0A516SG77_9NEIS|nr:tetratricopeptide repeat protein [Chitinimonas arctica]QDQ27165.1 tetratricopeptide repeat protein [Chitinimonas arctica]